MNKKRKVKQLVKNTGRLKIGTDEEGIGSDYNHTTAKQVIA